PDFGAGLNVGMISETRRDTRTRFDDDGVAELDDLPDGLRSRSDTRLSREGLSWYPDDHQLGRFCRFSFIAVCEAPLDRASHSPLVGISKGVGSRSRRLGFAARSARRRPSRVPVRLPAGTTARGWPHGR